jgi:hypothetical protein
MDYLTVKQLLDSQYTIVLKEEGKTMEQNRSRSRGIEKTTRMDARKGKKPLDMAKNLSRGLENKPESSQLSNHSPEQLEELIASTQKRKADFESALPELRECIENVKKKIEKIQKNEKLSAENSIERQLTIVKNDQILNYLMHKDIEIVKKERVFINSEKKTILSLISTLPASHDFEERLKKIKYDFPEYLPSLGIDLDTFVKDVKSVKITTIENFKNFKANFILKSNYRTPILLSKDYTFETEEKMEQAYKIATQSSSATLDRISKKPEVKQALDIINRRDLAEKRKKLESESKETSQILQEMRKKFVEVINKEDEQATRQAFEETLKAHQQDRNGRSALQIFKLPYLKKLTAFKNSGQMSKDDVERTKDIDKTLKDFDKQASRKEEKIELELQSLKKEYDQIKPLENEDQILDKAREYTYTTIEPILDRDVKWILIGHKLISFYNFVEKNITYRLSNSLDELEKKNQEALSLLEEEIKKLEALHPHKQSEQSNQPQVAMEQPSPADKLQNNLETAFKDADMTPECRAIVLSYLSGLFKKSHPQSSNDAKTVETFLKKNVNEAKQVATYLEQKHFIHHKIRDDVIQLAIHLKHAFGFPLHQANIDKDFNIVKSRPSKEGSSSLSRLDIDRQGRILKDGRVQRVYLIGFQDASEASSSDADAKPMALLAMQSTETGYPKYGAGTPLPTGGVVDVVTAQQSTPDQPNLYKATLAIETLQETHDQKAIDMQTLELFETETVMNPHTKAPLYEITTFTGKVKDKPLQALPEHSKPEEAYQETTGPCIVDLNKLLSTVRNIIEDRGRFCPLWRAMMYIKRQIAQQALGEENIPTSDQGWQTNGAIRWADFHEYSTSMNMFAKYLVLAYREELGLAGSK